MSTELATAAGCAAHDAVRIKLRLRNSDKFVGMPRWFRNLCRKIRIPAVAACLALTISLGAFLSGATPADLVPAQAGAEYSYVVRRGDTLSQIAADHIGRPIYPRDGSLAKLRRYNPWLRNVHTVREGQSLRILGGNPARAEWGSVSPAALSHVQRAPATLSREAAAEAAAEANAYLPNASSADAPPEAAPVAAVLNAPALTAPLLDAPSGATGATGATDAAGSSAPDYSQFFARAGGQFTRLDAHDRVRQDTALLVGDFSPGVAAGWRQVWSPRFSTAAEVQVQKLEILPSASREIEGRSQWYSQFQFGGTWGGASSASGLGAGLAAGLSQEVYLRSPNATHLRLEKVLTPYFLARGDARLWGRASGRGLRLGLGAEGATLAPAPNESGTSRWGYLGAVELNVGQQLELLALELKLRYDRKNYGNAAVQQTRQDLGLSFGVQWNVGAGTP